MRKSAIVVFVLLSSLLLAQSGLRLSTGDTRKTRASGIAARFCQMDFLGFRLTDEGRKKMHALTTWQQAPDWRVVTIVDRYQIAGVRDEGSRIVVRVGYQRLGRFEDNVGYSPSPAHDVAEFTLTEKNGEWLISEAATVNSPHISRRIAAKWLREKIASAQEPAWKEELQQTVRRLE